MTNRKQEVHDALNRCGIATRCGTAVIGCGKEFEPEDAHLITRCVDCGIWFHAKCARHHFAVDDEKDRLIEKREERIIDLLGLVASLERHLPDD